MCGRYTLTVDERFLRELFDISLEGLDYVPNYNICPGAKVPVIYSGVSGGGWSARLMRWGLIPRWAKEAAIGYKMINARAETVHQKPAYKLPFARQRCLIPADGFYEWKKGEAVKTPYRITLADNSLFSFAGLWDRWLSGSGEEVYSFSIITSDANSQVKDIHDRMPVILADRSSQEKWLDPETPGSDLRTLLLPYGGELVSYRVSSLVNSPRNNTPELISKIQPHN